MSDGAGGADLTCAGGPDVTTGGATGAASSRTHKTFIFATGNDKNDFISSDGWTLFAAGLNSVPKHFTKMKNESKF